jgi:PAS domain S-box-containing protein
MLVHDSAQPRALLQERFDVVAVRAGAEEAAALKDCDVALIDAEGIDAVAAAQRIRARDAALSVIIAAAAARHDALHRALMFAPGLGEVWVHDPAELDDAVARAAEVTRTRRRYKVTRSQIEQSLPGLGPTGGTTVRVSDAYLAALLQVLPDPVLSIDADGRVLSFSSAAQQVLGTGAAHGRGLRLAELIDPVDPGELEDLLRRGSGSVARGEVAWRKGDGAARYAELTIAPVEVAGHHIRAVVFRDTTGERAVQQQLEEQAAELEAQTMELSRQTDELEQQRDELTRLMAARSRFYASMSHEIRTPINAIIGYNDLLLAGVYGELPAGQLQSVERAQAAARHLRELVNDALDLSKIESGKLDVVMEECDLAELVRDIVLTILPLARERGARVQCSLGESIPLQTDPRRVRQILLNLLSNAVKFGAGRPVHVNAGRAEDRCFVEVRDAGPGMTADQLASAFEEFVQVHDGAVEGTGLGLAISKRLAMALGGTIAAASAPGAGTTFTLSLPLRRPE